MLALSPDRNATGWRNAPMMVDGVGKRTRISKRMTFRRPMLRESTPVGQHCQPPIGLLTEAECVHDGTDLAIHTLSAVIRSVLAARTARTAGGDTAPRGGSATTGTARTLGGLCQL
jgi:hypothetical protein